MPVVVKWENDNKTILHVGFDGKWTWAEFHQALSRICNMIAGESHEVDIVGDIRYAEPQIDGSPATEYSRALDMLPPNTGRIAVVGRGFFAAMIFSVVAGRHLKFGRRTTWVRSIDDAHAALERLRYAGQQIGQRRTLQ